MRKPQISASVDQEVQDAVKVEAEKDNRSFSETVEILLRQALKERERSRLKSAARKNRPQA
jgi:hypothetical protein